MKQLFSRWPTEISAGQFQRIVVCQLLQFMKKYKIFPDPELQPKQKWWNFWADQCWQESWCVCNHPILSHLDAADFNDILWLQYPLLVRAFNSWVYPKNRLDLGLYRHLKILPQVTDISTITPWYVRFPVTLQSIIFKEVISWVH